MTLKRRLISLALAFALATPISIQPTYAQEEGAEITDDGDAEACYVLIWCVTHNRHEKISC
jgi:hypothetical protein